MPRGEIGRERKRGINEPYVIVCNPLPDVAEEVLLEAAGLELIEPANISPFQMDWQWGGGFEREFVTLSPGEERQLRESEAKEFMAVMKPVGAAVWPADASPLEILRAKSDALRTAAKYYHDRGAKRISAYRKDHGIGKDELLERKDDLWAYFLNEEKAKACDAELKRLRSVVSEATTGEKLDAESEPGQGFVAADN